MHFAINYCKVHHFAEGTNLVIFQASVNTIDKETNHDLKNLLNANKVAANVSKTELSMFTLPKKQLDHVLKIKLKDKNKALSD